MRDILRETAKDLNLEKFFHQHLNLLVLGNSYHFFQKNATTFAEIGFVNKTLYLTYTISTSNADSTYSLANGSSIFFTMFKYTYLSIISVIR